MAENSADTIKNLAVQAAGTIHEMGMPDGREFIVHPPGYIVKDVSLPQNVAPPIPKYVKQEVEVQTKDSLVEYVERFKTEDTVIFADIDENRIVAVIDYHGPAVAGDAKVPAPIRPAITSHRAILDLDFSLQWQTWLGVQGAMYRQAEFARFIEENSEDILSPTGAALLEMVLDLEKSKSIRVVRKMRTAGSDDGTGGSTIEVHGTELPNVFQLLIPVYFGESPVGVKAFTRDALTNDKIITIGFKLARTEAIRQSEFLRISSEIAVTTGVPLIAGAIATV